MNGLSNFISAETLTPHLSPITSLPHELLCSIFHLLDANSVHVQALICKVWKKAMWQDQQYSLWDRAILMQNIKDGLQIEQLWKRYENSTQPEEKQRLMERIQPARLWAGPQYIRLHDWFTWPYGTPEKISDALCHLVHKGNSDVFAQILRVYLDRKNLDRSIRCIFQHVGEQILTETAQLLKQPDVSAVIPVCFVLNLAQWTENALSEADRDLNLTSDWRTAIIRQAFPHRQGQEDQRIERLQKVVSEATPDNRLLIIRTFSRIYNRYMLTPLNDNSAFVVAFKNFLMAQIQSTNDEKFIKEAEQAVIIAMSRIFYLHLKNGGGTTHSIFDLKEEFVKGALRSDILWQFIANLCELYQANTLDPRAIECRDHAMKLFDKLLKDSVFQKALSPLIPEENRDSLSILDDDWLERKLSTLVDGRCQIYRPSQCARTLENKWNTWKKHQMESTSL